MHFHEHNVEPDQQYLTKEINEIYWSTALKRFALGSLGVFEPIFLYLLFDKSIVAVLIYVAIMALGQVLLVPIFAKLLKFGVKKLMAIGNLIMALHYVALIIALTQGMTYVIIALVLAIFYKVIFWPASHTDFARFVQQGKRGQQVGVINIITSLSRAIAPLMGGVIIVTFGFTPLFIGAAILIALSSFPLFFSPEVYETYSLSWYQSFRILLSRKNLRLTAAFFFEGIHSVIALLFFPIFIFLVIGRLDTIGWITSATFVVTVVFTYYIGKTTDKRGGQKVISFASVANAFAWLINIFITTPIQYLIYSSFFRLASTANQLPFTTMFYQDAKKRGHGVDEFVVFHELAHNIGRITLLALAIIVFSLGFESFIPYFVIAAMAAFLFRLMK